MIQLTPTLYAVEVPDNAQNIKLINIYGGCVLVYNTEYHREINRLSYINTFELLGTYSPDGIDFDCEQFLERDFDCHPDVKTKWFYTHNKETSTVNKDVAFCSLLTSKGCDLKNKYVIIKSKI